MAGSDYLESPHGRYVHLQGGLVLPVDPVLLLLDLEARSFRLSRAGDDIDICPFSKLTEDDKRLLKLWKPHVLALLDYMPPKVIQ